MRDDAVYLTHIAESIDRIEPYLIDSNGTHSESLFYDDDRTQDAVLRRLETLADAASHLSEEIKARHPELPWRQIGDFRNVLAHGYADIRMDRVWDVIVDDLPVLKASVLHELDRTGST